MRVIFKNPWVQAGIALGAVTLLTVVSYFLSSVLIPLFFAFLVAYVFDPVIDYLETHGLSRIVAILMLVFGLTLVALMLPLFLLPNVVDQAESLVEVAQSPQTPDVVDRALRALPLEHWIREAGWVAEGEPIADPRQVIVSQVGTMIRDNASEFLAAHARDILGAGQKATQTAAGIFGQVASQVMGWLLLLGNFALFFFVAVYLLKDYDHIVADAGKMIPLRYRKTSTRIFTQIDSQLKAWLRGQAFVCFCLGCMYIVGFFLSGVPFAIVLGIVGGLVSFVPFLGLALTIGPAVLLTLLKYGLDWHVGGAIATLLIAQALEGNVITPRIMGKQVGLAPVWVILAIMVFGSTLGFVGLLLAVPLAAVLKVLIVECHDRYLVSEFFQGEDDDNKVLAAPQKRPRAKPAPKASAEG